MPEPEEERCIRLKIDCPPKKDGGLKAVGDRQREKQDMMERKYPKHKLIIKGRKIKKEHIVKDKIECITYHIYWNSETEGKIEKHVPKEITQGYENKYRYIYHDKENKEHEICTVDWFETKEKKSGIPYSIRPSHSKIITNSSISEGQTTQRVIYENGDIAEYGSHDTLGNIWMLYKSTGNSIQLIKMPENLDYSKGEISIKYSFENTERKYTNPNLFAGFIGILGDLKLKIISQGSSFKSASCFPSQTHVNGASIDLNYFYNLKNDQQMIDFATKYYFVTRLKGINTYCGKLLRASPSGKLHNTHLHIGGFNSSKIIEK